MGGNVAHIKTVTRPGGEPFLGGVNSTLANFGEAKSSRKTGNHNLVGKRARAYACCEPFGKRKEARRDSEGRKLGREAGREIIRVYETLRVGSGVRQRTKRCKEAETPTYKRQNA